MKPLTAFIAPHRTGFLLGSLLLLASLAWWAIEMLARHYGLALGTRVPPMFLHGYLMLYGFFPLFMLGFIYTAGPRWLNVPAPALSRYVPVMVLYAAGSALVLGGGWFTSLLTVGILLHVIGWAGALLLWLGRIRASQAPDRLHAVLVALAFALGLCGQLLALWWSAVQSVFAWQASVEVGVWGFLLPVFLVVSHRMLPFFSSNVLTPYTLWKPRWLLYSLLALALAHAALTLAGMQSWPVDALMAGLLACTSLRWGLLASLRVPLLAMLHASFAWAALALTLYTVQGWNAAQGWYMLGFAPLHALTLGFFATMLLGFVTRVSLGHSGRPLVAGRLSWTLYWLVHGVALTRVLAEVVPGWQQPMYMASALGAVLAFMAWGSRFVPLYVKARADGKEG